MASLFFSLNKYIIEWPFDLQMYVSRLGHTDGDDHPVFILLTDHSIYFLNQNQTDLKFLKDSSVPYSSIDYISVRSSCINTSYLVELEIPCVSGKISIIWSKIILV